MKCYYEELDVNRDANDADIKSSYRKLALRWHPDKNLENPEEAKERFQLIQQAYEVLSDPHERAWYDNHREQILRGKNSDYEDNCLDVFQYFTVSCFQGYGDDAKGFYATYREVFFKIAAEDLEFMDDEEEIAKIPTFGSSTSSYEAIVGPFYAYWQAYCTKKTYTWLCPYDIQEIKDRRILREVEKDLKKIAQKAKKERNDEVRNLVSFVRKRDKRVQAFKVQLEERAALNRQKQEQNRQEQIRKRQQELKDLCLNASDPMHENYEEKLKELEHQYAIENGYEDSSDFESDEAFEKLTSPDDLYCIACNKVFKNVNAFDNHQTSKKHLENIARLMTDMQEEEEAFNDDNLSEQIEGTDHASDVPPSNADEDADEGPFLSSLYKKKKKSKKANKPSVHQECSSSNSDEDEPPHGIASTKAGDSDDGDWNNGGKKSARKGKTKKQAKKTTANAEVGSEAVPKIEAKPTPAPSTVRPASVTPAALDGIDTAHVCVTCKSVFASKNKLFTHLKATNHGVYLPKAGAQPESGQKKAKGKRK